MRIHHKPTQKEAGVSVLLSFLGDKRLFRFIDRNKRSFNRKYSSLEGIMLTFVSDTDFIQSGKTSRTQSFKKPSHFSKPVKPAKTVLR